MSVTMRDYPFLRVSSTELEASVDFLTLRCFQCGVARDQYGEPRFYIFADVEGTRWIWCHTCLYEREPIMVSVPGRFPDDSTFVLIADVDSTMVYDRRCIEWMGD
ncbi:MAG TPA: hypothetical protein VIJ40_05495 [Acidimicrobiales bacterium]